MGGTEEQPLGLADMVATLAAAAVAGADAAAGGVDARMGAVHVLGALLE